MRSLSARLSIGAFLGLAFLLFLAPLRAQIVRTADATIRGFRESDFPRITKLADNVYAYEDLNGTLTSNLAFTTNSLIVVTAEGVLVADGQGSVAKTRRMVEEIAKITPQPIRYMVVCADHGDHIAGNSALPANVTLIAHPTSKAVIERQAAGRGAQAAAAGGRAGRGNQPAAAGGAGRANQPAAAPAVRVPQETVSDRRVLTMGGTEIQILFLGRAHTGGDLHIFLPRENILFMSEAFFNRLYPSVGGSRSAYPIEWIETIKKAEALNARVVVPGHGFVDPPDVLKEELVNFRRALENLVAESRRMHAANVSLENAPRGINLGEFQYWYRAANNMPDAVRQVYLEIEGKLP